MIKEIGSEFHSSAVENASGIPFPRKGSLTFCGRTAIEAVLKKTPQAKTALLPSYCCDSMIEPFRRAGISVQFFDVNYDGDLIIKVDKNADVLLWCNYFGFRNDMPDFDGVIIEDITHSLLSCESHHSKSDYLIASVRKWEPIYCGGYCSVETEGITPPSDFVAKKAGAMSLKAEYLDVPDPQKKALFLSAFTESNEWLANNYSGLGIDDHSKKFILNADVTKQREIRRRNARVLYEGLRGKVDFLFDEEQMDCPLFVPIVLRKNRDSIRRHLTDNKIYCPVHWPHPNADCSSNLYGTELSLICDQRYDENDMERIVSVILNKL